MDNLRAIQRLLDDSSDPDNPRPEAISDLFERIRTIAVIGMSRDPAKAARRVPAYLATRGYEIIPVNPYGGRMLGRKVRASLDEVEDPVDMVVIFRPTGEAGRFVTQAARRPERPVIWLQEGIRADDEVRAARAGGLMVVQDLCAFRVHRALSGL